MTPIVIHTGSAWNVQAGKAGLAGDPASTDAARVFGLPQVEGSDEE